MGALRTTETLVGIVTSELRIKQRASLTQTMID